MINKILIAILIVVVAVTGYIVYFESNNSQRIVYNKSTCVADECLTVGELNYPVSELGDNQQRALEKAIDDEYKAYASYDAVLKKFGNVRPFIMIIRSEEQHISSLKALFDKYGLQIPNNNYTGNMVAPSTVTEACKLGVNAEIANANLYQDTLLPEVNKFDDIKSVFTTLMNVSKYRHLQAFQRCAN